ncbi:Zinc finger, PHD-type [Sesbania bispinosa]|nr:Zinc finger, PHD-type [Sesbania bispinosa]
MKGRSHRPQSTDPPDDWVDGSWTVDCICGVTFDDGEEMVKCDECGVWVHTRCSRYVKGDDMFACDKCKNKTNGRADNNTEETEVAQLLVELPTKTISLENNNNSFASKVAARSRRPFKLWTDIPMEERVHVQGIPGGDPSLFAGRTVPSIFSPQLWKCTEGAAQENDNGAGVLFSFSKETSATAVLASPVAALVDMRSSHGREGKTGFKDMGMNKFGGEDGTRVHNAIKKERSLLRPLVVHSSKRRKEDLGNSNSKDRSGKKRVKISSDKEVDPKRRSSHSSKPAFTPTSDAKQLEFYEDRGPKIFKADTRSIKNKNLKDIVVQEHVSNDYFAVDTIAEEPNNNLTTTEESSEALYPNITRHSLSVGDVLADEKTGHKLVEMSSKTDDAVTSILNHNKVGNASVKEKDGDCLAADNVDDTLVARSTVSPQTEDHCGSAPELKDNQASQDLDCNLRPSSAKCKVKVKKEDDDDDFKKLSNFHSSPISDLKNNEKPSDHASDIVKVNDVVVPSLSSRENKMGDVDISSKVVPDDHTNKPDELLSGNFCHGKQEVEGSEGSLETQKGFSETKDGSDSAKDPSKSEAPGCPHKMLACVGKSSPTSSTMNSKSLSHDFKSEDTEIPNSFTKHGLMSDCNIHIKNESCPSDVAKDEIPRKSVRDRPKSSNSNSKGLHSSRSAQISVSKQVNSDARDSVHCSSSKVSLAHQTASTLGASETNASLHHQKALQMQNKVTSSVPQKVEKLNQTSTHPSSKLNQSNVPTVNPSPTSNSSMLSDEELALLLHQELNSSPRVPRVPRARHAGSLPQLTSASATSMLMKRTTSVGGKDHYLVSRRKYKDASRDGFGSSREPEDEAKKIEKEKGPSTSDQRKQDIAYVEDAAAKEEGERASVTAAITNNVVSATSAIANSSPSSPPDDQNLSSIRNSPRNISDDDTATAGRPVHHTLPGLINDIMSKGRRMTYEELCNAVLPHWHNLRKHNGERYAYSSHSQAVLDCLRNRNEWARLVDRGPKTNSNRKRRKLDADESDDNGYGKGRNSKEADGKNFELQKEEFPKGKRKARKRRRLALQGRAVKDVRRRQKADSLTDEDVGPFSNSSEESMFSEDEIQVGRICAAGSTSDEAVSSMSPVFVSLSGGELDCRYLV